MRASLTEILESAPTQREDLRWFVPQWYALYTRSRHEKIAAEQLAKKNIQTFLPLRTITRRWSDRKKIIQQPLFAGYLFVHTALDRRWNVLNSQGVVRFVGPSPGNPIAVPERDITAIQRFVKEEIDIDPFPYLKEGTKVYVRAGPFKGTEGFIVRKDGRCRLILSLEVLMQSVSIEIDQACVEPV
ncbi:MAG TPA: UpxY family transcription antiterminator [Verrucomicrobiae bacterium]|jgi:transcription antitermination factor NusG|nr:UpxY family transcription antiterminator [Verrucomicrobiae bacterium]